MDRLVGCDSGGGAFESDGGQDGEVFRHMLCDEGMGCGRGCLGGESTGWAAGSATREYWEVCWEEPYAGDTALDCFASAMKDDGFADLIHLSISWGGRVISSETGIEKRSRSDARTVASYLKRSFKSRSSCWRRRVRLCCCLVP